MDKMSSRVPPRLYWIVNGPLICKEVLLSEMFKRKVLIVPLLVTVVVPTWVSFTLETECTYNVFTFQDKDIS